MDRIKISCIVMLICLWISTDVWAQEVIHVEVAGTLPVLIGDKKETVEELTLTGKLNGTDIKCIREMKKLRTLDMNGTEILKSDIVYYVEPYTANGEHVIIVALENGVLFINLTARPANIFDLSNKEGAVKVNNVELFLNDETMGKSSAKVTIVEPTADITKKFNVTEVEGLDHVSFDVIVKNNGKTPLFEVTIIDNLEE